MTRILVVENEPFTAERLKSCLGKAGYEAISVTTGEQALELVKNNHYGTILMDIHLDGKIDGITAARSISRLSPSPIIFITELNDEEVFMSAKETYPQNYISKPFNDLTVLRAVELAIKNAEKQIPIIAAGDFWPVIDGIFIPDNGFKVKLLFNDILYLEASGAYTNIYYETNDSRAAYYKVSKSSNHVAEQLAFPALVKVNRSFYVNIRKIEKYQKSSVFIKDKEITVTEEYTSKLKQILRSL